MTERAGETAMGQDGRTVSVERVGGAGTISSMRTGTFALLIASAVLGSASRVDAECALRIGASPNSEPIPLQGSVYGYTDSYEPLPVEIAWTAGTGTAQFTRLSGAITRVDYAGNAGAVLTVNGTRYTLAPHAPTPHVPQLISIARHKGAWTCSSYDYLAIELDSSPAAVHARWTRDGVTSDYWVVASENTIALGELNCGGTTLPPSEIDLGGHLALFAVFPDGSEHLFADEEVHLRPSLSNNTVDVALRAKLDEIVRAGGPGSSDGGLWVVVLTFLVAGSLLFGAPYLAPRPAAGARRSAP
jgi:hypothetical protein